MRLVYYAYPREPRAKALAAACSFKSMHRAINVARDGPLPRHCPVEGIVPCVVPAIRQRAGPVGSHEHRRCEHRGGTTQVSTLGPINDSVTYVNQRYIIDICRENQTACRGMRNGENHDGREDHAGCTDSDTAERYLFNAESAQKTRKGKDAWRGFIPGPQRAHSRSSPQATTISIGYGTSESQSKMEGTRFTSRWSKSDTAIYTNIGVPTGRKRLQRPC